MTEFLYKMYLLLQKHKIAFGVSLCICFGLLIWTASLIKFDEDISKLIPTTTENEKLQKVLKTAQFADKIIVNIQREPEGSLEDLTSFGSDLYDSLTNNTSQYIKIIQGKVDDETAFETLDFVYDHLPLFLSDDDYEMLSKKIQPDSIAVITQNNYRTLISPSGIIAKKTIVKDPLGISLMALQQLKKLGFGDDFVLKDNFLVTRDEQHLLLFITPKYDSGDTNNNAIFADQLDHVRDQLNQRYLSKASGEYFGGTLIAVANAQQIKKDIQLTVSIALTILMVLFIVFYRKLTIPIILFVPTLFGGLLSIAILYFIRSEISAISLGIGSVLLGVTLDYSLHILTHIRNNETIHELYRDVTKPILMSSLTTALAFLCLLFVDSQALQDLGIFAAVSVIGASVFALVFIPQVYKNQPNKITKTTVLDQLALYKFHTNKIVIGLIALAMLVSVFTYQKVTFNQDISKLNFEPEAIKTAQKHLEDILNISSKSMYVITYGKSQQEVLETNDSIYKVLQGLQKNDQILSFNSLGALVNSKKNQKQKIDQWKQFWTPDIVKNTKQNLIESGRSLGFKPETFHEFYDLLNSSFTTMELKDYQLKNLIAIEDFMASENGFYTLTSTVKVTDEQIDFIKTKFNNNSNIMVIDRQGINETLLGNLKNEFNTLIIYCFIVVLLLLLVFYKNIKLTLVTLIPIVITWFVTIGIMGVFEMEFNIFNVIISTFIFGLGIDYSIFMTNGLLKEMKTGISALPTHKTSIMLSVITTVLGVGVLIFAKHPALYSISVISIIGILTAMTIAFTIQPLLFNLLIKNDVKHQSANHGNN